MKEAINNFIKLLVKGDFFLIFLLVMIVIVIIGIIYLIRLEFSYRENDDEEEEDLSDNIELFVKDKEEDIAKDEEEITEENLPINLEELPKEEVYENTFENPLEEDIKEEAYVNETPKEEEKKEEVIINEAPTFSEEDIKEPIKEDTLEVEPIKEEVKEEVSKPTQMNMFDYENEQEERAIISTEELVKRLNDLKSSGDYTTTEEEIDKYESEQEEKAIISYDELLKRASEGVVNYEEKEDLGGLTISKVDFDKGREVTFDYQERENTFVSPYQKEEDFLSSLKAFRRSL